MTERRWIQADTFTVDLYKSRDAMGPDIWIAGLAFVMAIGRSIFVSNCRSKEMKETAHKPHNKSNYAAIYSFQLARAL